MKRSHDRHLRQADAHPCELGDQEPPIELDVVGNNHPAAQGVEKRRRDLLESGSADYIACLPLSRTSRTAPSRKSLSNFRRVSPAIGEPPSKRMSPRWQGKPRPDWRCSGTAGPRSGSGNSCNPNPDPKNG
jgi:hypothetical protein